MLKVIPLEFDGLFIIQPQVFSDNRGFFFELWNAVQFAKCGLELKFVQDNVSRSARGVIRGLHFQNPQPQGKLISVLEGEIFDVVVDLRKSSKTFKKWLAVPLSDKNRHQLYIPPGFAHGFQVLSQTALFAYKCTEIYSPAAERTLKWDDPDLRIDWPIANVTVSDKDQHGIPLNRWEPSDLFE